MPPAVGAAPSQGLNKWSRPVASPSTSKPSEISVHSAESQPSIVAPAVRAAFPQGLNNWAQPVAPPSKSKPSETSILNSNSPLSITPLPTRKVSHPKNKLTSLSPDSDHANSSPTLPEARAIGASLQRRNNWARPVAPPSKSKPSEISFLNSDSQPSIAPLPTQKISHPKNKASKMVVFIPSAISVAALATLLNVKLGTYSLA